MRLTIDLDENDIRDIVHANSIPEGPCLMWALPIIRVCCPELTIDREFSWTEVNKIVGKQPLRQFEFDRNGKPRVPRKKHDVGA